MACALGVFARNVCCVSWVASVWSFLVIMARLRLLSWPRVSWTLHRVFVKHQMSMKNLTCQRYEKNELSSISQGTLCRCKIIRSTGEKSWHHVPMELWPPGMLLGYPPRLQPYGPCGNSVLVMLILWTCHHILAMPEYVRFTRCGWHNWLLHTSWIWIWPEQIHSG